MPMPKPDQTKDEYIAEFMTAPHAQHFPEDQRVAVAEHEYASHMGEHDGVKTPESALPLQLTGDVRFEGDGVLRYESSMQDKPIRIDRTVNTMFGVRGMLAKPVRKDYFYNLEAQRRVHDRYESMVVGHDHDYKQGPPTIARTVGKVIKSYMDENGTLFDIQYNPAHERMEQILKDAETGLNTISLSCVTQRCEQHGNEVVDFIPAGVDFVVNAGQTSKLFEQADASRSNTDTRLEQALGDIALLKSKLSAIEAIQPAAVITQVTRHEQNFAARGVDLNAFHDQFLKAKG